MGRGVQAQRSQPSHSSRGGGRAEACPPWRRGPEFPEAPGPAWREGERQPGSRGAEQSCGILEDIWGSEFQGKQGERLPRGGNSVSPGGRLACSAAPETAGGHQGCREGAVCPPGGLPTEDGGEHGCL